MVLIQNHHCYLSCLRYSFYR